MSNTKTTKAAGSAPDARAKAAKAGKGAELKDSDLDKVAGGLNPQPLPPGVYAGGKTGRS